MNYQNPQFATTSADGIKQIQLFTDHLNYLLDNDFSYIKKLFYPNVWKRGVAVFEYTETDLSYALYSIKYGENSLLIKELPLDEMKNQHGFLSLNCAENKMQASPEELAMEMIKNDFESFIKSHRVLPPYEDFIKEFGRDININTELLKNVPELMRLLEKRYYYIKEGMRTSVSKGASSIRVDILYGALKLLSNRGYEEIPALYPEKSLNGSTGYVCDFFSMEEAKIKAFSVLKTTISAYDNYVQTYFPLLYPELDLFFGADLILINIKYTGEGGDKLYSGHDICLYYFKSKMKRVQREILFFHLMKIHLFINKIYLRIKKIYFRKIRYFTEEMLLMSLEEIVLICTKCCGINIT